MPACAWAAAPSPAEGKLALTLVLRAGRPLSRLVGHSESCESAACGGAAWGYHVRPRGSLPGLDRCFHSGVLKRPRSTRAAGLASLPDGHCPGGQDVAWGGGTSPRGPLSKVGGKQEQVSRISLQEHRGPKTLVPVLFQNILEMWDEQRAWVAGKGRAGLGRGGMWRIGMDGEEPVGGRTALQCSSSGSSLGSASCAGSLLAWVCEEGGGRELLKVGCRESGSGHRVTSQ